ncbi:MAG: sulfatase-like hydrolase/transferase [Gammaproteobacteria bacterium]|nr:sulfatase-like hydrolase/transferase [Gammaproteobacteria bacterium]
MFKKILDARATLGLAKHYLLLSTFLLVLGLPLHASAAQEPYSGTPWAVPGLIEAENYDLGGSGVAYQDATAGNEGNLYRADNVDIWASGDVSGAYMVGSTKVGEWLEYTVDVAAAGTYTLNLRTATAANGKQARILMDGVDISGPIAIPNTGGWTTWQTISRTVTLNAGQKVMRLQVDAGSFNINWISFTANNAPPTLAAIDAQTVTEGHALNLPISATDSDGPAPLTLSQTNTLPGNPSILTDNGDGTGTLNWTPATGNASGSPYSVTVTATDGAGGTSSLTFGITVLPDTPPSEKPNIVVILTDDHGYGDVGYVGLASDLQTPNIDDLAAHGMRFNNFYANSSVCSPTRAALMTGRYPALVGVPGTVARDPVTNMGYFSPTGPTLPELLKSAGYTTGLIGKWHLGDYLGEDPHNLPTRRGFDYFHGFIGAAGDYYTHDGSSYGWPGNNLLMLNETVLNPASLQGIHTTDLLTQWAKDYIQEKSGSSQPFMMYLAYSAPHDPLQPPQAYLDEVLAHQPGIDPERAKMVALIKHLDDSIGQVIQKLKDSGVYDNTLIIFNSDNGGYLLHKANNGPYRGGKLDFYEGGIHVPMVAVWPGRIQPGTQSAEIALTMDLYPTLAEVAGATVSHSIEGRSILPTLLGQNPQYPARDLFFENRSTFTDTLWKTHYAVRRQDWKLVQGTPGGTFELYNLASDPYETQNLAGANPAKVAELTAALNAYKAQESLVPWQPPLELERGEINNLDAAWRTIPLSHRYRAPIVLTSVQYASGAMPPVVTRIRNADDLTVDHASFDIRLERADNSNAAITPATVQYLVVEAGVYNQAHHGATLEALRLRPNRTDSASSWVGTQRPYANAYAQPVVLGQVMSYNDADFSTFWSRGTTAQNPPNTNTLYIGKHVGEDADKTRSSETLGYLVMNAGPSSLGGQTALAGLSSAVVQGVDDTPPFNVPISGLTQPQTAIVSQSGMKGVNGGWAVLFGPGAIATDHLALAIDEDQKADVERSHLSGEQVAYLVFDSQAGLPTASDPAFVPDGGTYQNSVDVQLSSATPGAAIRYTTDGSTPNSASALYTAPFTLTATTTVKAIAILSGYHNSAVVSRTFTLQTGGQAPYGGSPWPIPGLIEAENYDLGGAGVGYSDTTTGNAGNIYRGDDVDIWNAGDTSGAYMVGSTAAGEWMRYSVNVAAAGTYTLNLRVATAASGKKLHFLVNGADITGPITVPNTGGWTTWQTISKTVTLNAGPQTLRLQVDSGSFNVNWISFTSNGGSNAAPMIGPVGSQTIVEGQPLVVPVTATDIDGPAPLTLAQTNTLPGNPNILTDHGSGAGTLNWTPSIGAAAGSPYSVTVTATDGAGAAASLTFNVTVVGNQAPTLDPIGGQTVSEGQPLGLSVTATDADGPAPLTLAQTNTLPGNPNILTDYGNGAGTLNWTPPIGAAGGGPYSVTVTATDGAGAFSSLTFNVTVVGNQAPALDPIGDQTASEGQSLGVSVTATDADGPAPLTLTQTNTLPGNPNILTDYGSGNGFIDWTPPVGSMAGSPYSVTVTATDGSGHFSSRTFTITVTNNLAPTLTPIVNRVVTEGQPLIVPVTAADTDGPAPLTLAQTNTLPGNPNILTDHSNGAGTLNWTPSIGAAAGSPYAVTVTATDGDGATASASFKVTVVSATQPPYGGTPWPIPGIIEAENYDLGGPNIAYKDATAGNEGGLYRGDDVDIWNSSDVSGAYMVGSTKAGEWLEYTVEVQSAGAYTLSLRVATAASGKQARILMNGNDITGPVSIPNTGGWTTWQTISIPVNLGSAGQKVMRLQVDNGSFNINWIGFASAGALPLPYSENFSSGFATNWQVVNDSGQDPSWGVTAGEYRQNNFVGNSGDALQGGYHRGTYSYLIPGMALTDYTFSVKAVPMAASGQDVGVMVRVNPNDNSYTRLSYSAANGFARLETRTGGAFHTLAKNARGYMTGTPLNITMKAQGPVVIASVNGEKLFGAYDASLSSGTVGLYCRDQCAFDDVLIQANDTAPMVAISAPAAWSVSPGATFDVGAVVVNKPAGATVEFQLDNLLNSCTAASEAGHPGLFTASCTAPSQGIYQLSAVLRDPSNVELDSDTNPYIGAGGDNHVAFGDSITNGMDDSTASDGVSQHGWVIASQGYEAILTDLLNAQQPYHPSIVNNAGVPGDTSTMLLNDRLTSVLEGYPDSNKFIVTIGVNDANGTLFTPSGLGCGGSQCNGTFKGNLQAIINQLSTAGKSVLVNLAPPRFGDPFQAPYTDPANHARNLLIRDGYNAVIANELTGRQVGANLYNYFLGSENRFYLYATNLHPNALGYEVMAHLIYNALTGNSTPPFVASALCLRLSQGGACANPLPYKENLMEPGDPYYVDQVYPINGPIPAALAHGRWILTGNLDKNAANSDYLSFNIPAPATLYVAYDANAVTLPSWLSSGFVDSGSRIYTSNPSAPEMKLYRKDNASGNIVLGGANATANGALANYIAIVVKN